MSARKCLIGAALTANLLAAATLSLGTSTTTSGATATLNVSYATQGDQFTGVQFDLDYDTVAFTLTATAGSTALAAGKDVSVSTDKKRVLVVGLNSNILTDGTLVVLNFLAKDTTSPGDYPIAFRSAMGTDARGSTKPISTLGGNIQVIAGVKPVVVPGGVRNNFTNEAQISSSAFTIVYGSNFGGVGRSWTGADFVNNQLPTALDGISATINGRSAYVVYVGANQINLLSPEDPATGSVDVQVRTPGGLSDAVKVAKTSYAPGVATYSAEGLTYVTATRADGSITGKTNFSSPGYRFRPAVPGETVTFWGSGFGPANPPISPGQILGTIYPLDGTVRVSIGGVSANVTFAGYVSPGLVQINCVVPNTTSGLQPVAISVNGSAVPLSMIMPIN